MMWAVFTAMIHDLITTSGADSDPVAADADQVALEIRMAGEAAALRRANVGE